MVIKMADNVRELRPKAPESEKITINLGYVDLGHIDLMVQDGFYSNRTDFIRTAIRNQLDRHTDAVKQSVARKKLDLGLRHYTREELEAVEVLRRPLVRGEYDTNSDRLLGDIHDAVPSQRATVSHCF